MRYFLMTVTIVAMFAAIALASVSGFIALSVFIESRVMVCADAFWCPDPSRSSVIFLLIFVISSLATWLLSTALGRLVRARTVDDELIPPSL
ncbi:hypothetical protein [Devosia sp. SL43]|uniref:hypothetical protein n=1 Tax=Devosia sp. SL43 TaxID=2806348 RepID=UPI001F365353|nr:hypothetical protein [Devosia sp. SL43]UJW85632.1 hypothetical protein IM737_19955 [Devosia sp. SL43]